MLKILALMTMVTVFAHPVPAHAWVEDFEAAAPGILPSCWEMPATSRDEGWSARVTADADSVAGKHCLELSFTNPKSRQGPSGGASVSRGFDATPFRGKTVRLVGQVRHRKDERTNGWAQIQLQARRSGGVVLARQSGGDRPVSASTWTRSVVALEVPSDADTLEVGVAVAGAGTAWLDAVQFEETSVDLSRWNMSPAPLSDRGLDNLVALARLYGYVRFFHPSDEAFATHWGDFLLAAIGRVEPASSPAELRERLLLVFAPIAPTLEFAPSAYGADKFALPAGSKHDYVLWKHEGYGVEQPRSFYKSRRIASQGLRSLLDKELRDAPKPGAVMVGELAKDVCFRMPLVLHTEDGETRPKPTASRQRLDVPEEWGPNAADRGTRLAGVIVAWNVFQHFYPYFDVMQVDWPLALREALAAAAMDADRDDYVRTLRRMTALTRDGHVHVSHSFDERPFLLPLDWDWVDGRLVVTRVGDGVDANLPRRGDVVESLNGRAIEDCISETRPQIAAASEGWLQWRLRDQLLRWPSPDAVHIGVREASGKQRTVQLVPAIVAWKRRLRDARPVNGAEIAPGIVYFDLDGTDESELEKALPKLSAARSVVLDMRGYPGGAGRRILEHLAREGMTSAYWNVPHIFQPDRRDMTFVTGGRWQMKVREPHIPASGGKVVFVTDGRAISYAESCMGIVEAYDLGTIVGSATAATNGDITSIRLPGGFRISFTGLQVLKHDGTPHHGVGIRPTVPAARTLSGIAAGRDELLEKAIEIARGS